MTAGNCLLWAALAVVSALPLAAEPSRVRIERSGSGGFRLNRNGQPYFIRGAVGSVFLRELAAAGGNSIRAGGNTLDQAQALGLTVLVNLPLAIPRRGFNYRDTAALEQQRERIGALVRQYKDHPAVLMWAVGNEPTINTPREERMLVWREVDRIARLIHELDPNHPVISVTGGENYRNTLSEIDEWAPSLDAIGLNSYADMPMIPEFVRAQGWRRPYVITEFGPRGHWQVAKTSWGMPVEDSSTEKAQNYRVSYEKAVQNVPQCLGSYVFHWSQHHEKTHTWYGMFLPGGARTEAVDAMTEFWSGRPPANRAPRIGEAKIRIRSEDGSTNLPVRLPVGVRISAEVQAEDPDGDSLMYQWELRKDVADNPNVGGDREDPTPPLSGVIARQGANRTEAKLPQTPGHYRLFVYVHDGRGAAATANLPLDVQDPKYPPLAPVDEAKFGAGIQRTMRLLATSTPEKRNRVRVLFYGQSITKQDWTRLVAEDLRRRFPHADLEIENRAIGGYSSQFLIRTLPHDVYGFYPDLIIFHDFGSEPQIEEILRETRRKTTAEILVQTYYPQGTSEDRESRMAKTSFEFFPKMCERIGCEVADVRGQWSDYLKANGLKPGTVLSDGTHLNFYGDWLLAEITKRYLRYDPKLPVRDAETVYAVPLRKGNGTVRLPFEGNRVELVGDAVMAPLTVLVDGKRPSSFPELYGITRPSDTYAVDWPAVNRIAAEKPLLAEDWTLRILETDDQDTRFRFEVIGSVTGPDGVGTNTERFVSKSGRVVIEPSDWAVKRARDLRFVPMPPGFEVKWSVERRFADFYAGTGGITLASGLANGKHALELRGGLSGIREIRVYRPPLP